MESSSSLDASSVASQLALAGDGSAATTARKLYFCGSIRGGYADVDTYCKLITYLKHYGVVLTEHVGDPNTTAKLQDVLSDEQIWLQDMDWLAQTDVVIAECTTPSLGVGYEIGVAEKLGKPILCLFRPTAHGGQTRSLSAMIRGNPKVVTRYYTNFAEACAAIDEFLRAMPVATNSNNTN